MARWSKIRKGKNGELWQKGKGEFLKIGWGIINYVNVYNEEGLIYENEFDSKEKAKKFAEDYRRKN